MPMMFLAAMMMAQAPAAAEAVLPAQPVAVAPAPATAPSAKAKEKKICKTDEADSGSHMTKRTCLTAEEWAQRGQGMINNSRSGMSASPDKN
jgi:hypothetical protein